MPFVSVNLNREQHQVLALAAVFQASQLVHLIATSGSNRLGEFGHHYINVLLQAALNIRAGLNPNMDSLMFFHSIQDLHLGLHTLEHSLAIPYDPQPKQRYPKLRIKNPKQSLSYAMALLHLSSKVYRNKSYQQYIEKMQLSIIRQLSFFDHNYQHPSITAALAQTYSDTASQLKPRIMVKGSAHAFQNNQEIALIRALLFSGLQAAHYWRDLGGSPWKLIFSKGKIIKEIKYFAEHQHLSAENQSQSHSS